MVVEGLNKVACHQLVLNQVLVDMALGSGMRHRWPCWWNITSKTGDLSTDKQIRPVVDMAYWIVMRRAVPKRSPFGALNFTTMAGVRYRTPFPERLGSASSGHVYPTGITIHP